MSRDFLIHNGKLTSDLDADGNLIKNLPGVAHLVDGKVPSDELPSYVDDVLEYATRSSFPETGERGKIYIALDTNKQYRWGGTTYVEIAGTPTLDDAVTRTSANGVKSSGIWSMLWGALSTLPTGFSSLYDWVVAQLGLKRDYTDLSYDTTETVEVPALHSVMTVGGQTLAEYDLLCTEEVPDPPQIGHTYTWRVDGAAFYVTQGVSALQTTWILYSQNGESLDGVTTQNATQGFYPDLDFRPSGAVITIHKTTAQKTVTVEDELALKSDIPAPSTATPAMDGTGAAGTSVAFARGDHVHPTDTSRVPTSRKVNGKALSADVELTGADIAVSGTDATKISAALAGKATKADATLTPIYGEWACNPAYVQNYGNITLKWDASNGSWYPYGDEYHDTGAQMGVPKGNASSTSLTWAYPGDGPVNITASRSVTGYQLGSQSTRPLASEAEAEALRTGKANRAANPTAGNLAALDASGNPTDSLIPAANVALKGDIPYDRITITTGQLQDHAVQKVTLNAATTTLSLPALTDLTGKVSDFGIDMVNGYAPSDTPTAASFSLAGTIGTDYNIIVPEGEDWSEMSSLAAGEMAQFYFTLSAFAINDKPTWKVVKQVVELVPVPSAP